MSATLSDAASIWQLANSFAQRMERVWIHPICLSLLPAICFRLLCFMFRASGVPMAKLKQILGQTLNTNLP
uniref:Bestrophin homolog n=1 Tax=Globodera pallida TaxID=36090 RepID=A0A183CDL1_GLOPA